MQALTDTPLIKFNPDTLEVVRREYDLQQPGRMQESVDRLEEWVKGQAHFNKKDYSRKYLETFIIYSKGSIERAKEYIEKLCAYKTYGPQYFAYSTKPIDFKGLENIHFFCLPRLTNENCRVIFLNNMTQKDYTLEVIMNYLIKSHFMLEYRLKHDYSLGVRLILDYRKTDLSFLIKALKYTECRNGVIPFFKGYGTRLKSVHIISDSKVTDLLVSIVSQIVSPKLFGRISIHANIEEVYEHIDKDLLPSDYGGKEKSSKELSDEWDKELSTDKFMEYIKDMFQATINPSLKPMEKFDDPFMSMNGTFRTLSID